MKNLIVGQSGGPTAVINGSLYGVVTEGLKARRKSAKYMAWYMESRDSLAANIWTWTQT